MCWITSVVEVQSGNATREQWLAALNAAAEAIENGERNAATLKKLMHQIITTASLARIEYVSIANSHTLEEMAHVSTDTLLSLAVFFEDVRLIDNKTVPFAPTEHKKRG